MFGNYALFGNVAIFFFSSFFIITFDWQEHFEFWRLHRKYQEKYQNIPHVKFKKYLFIYKNQILGENWKCLGHFFLFLRNYYEVQWFSKFRLFHQNKHIKIYQTTTSLYEKKDLKIFFSKMIFSSEKLRNSGNCIDDYAHSLFGENF